MAGVAEELEGLRLLHNLPGVHHIHIVAQLGHHPHVVGDKQDGGAVVPAQVPHKAEDLSLDGHVQGGGGLVGNEQLRLAGHGHGDHHPLAQAPGELPGIVVQPAGRVGDAHLAEEVRRFFPGLGPVQPLVEPQHLRHLGPHGVHRVQGGHGVLEDHGDPVAPKVPQLLFRQLPQVPAPEEDLPLGHLARGAHQAQHRQGGDALAAAGLPHKPHDGAPGHRQVDAVHGGECSLFRLKFRFQPGDG